VSKNSASDLGFCCFVAPPCSQLISSCVLPGAKLPKIEKVEPWDGKDGELPAEEEIDLSDVDLDKDEL